MRCAPRALPARQTCQQSAQGTNPWYTYAEAPLPGRMRALRPVRSAIAHDTVRPYATPAMYRFLAHLRVRIQGT